MKKYRIFFEREGIEPVDFYIDGEGSNCTCSGIKVGPENLMFPFKGTEQDIINAIKSFSRLDKFGILNIHHID